MKRFVIAAALGFGMFAVQAQTPTPAPASTAPQRATSTMTKHPAHNCMMADDKVWASMNLTPEQTKKVSAIQAQCMKECGPKMKENPNMSKMMDKHEAEVKAVLTPAQYDSWMKWCSTQAAAPAMKPATAPAEKK